jgi:hypothetical protein
MNPVDSAVQTTGHALTLKNGLTLQSFAGTSIE